MKVLRGRAMASANPFDLLGDNDNDDPSQLIASAHLQLQQHAAAAADAVAAAASGSQRGKVAKSPTKPLPPAQAAREAKNVGGRGSRGAGRAMAVVVTKEGKDGEFPQRAFERRSGTGRGVTKEEADKTVKNLPAEKKAAKEDAVDVNKGAPQETEENEPEDKEMTLEEYQKLLEEKRKALQALKTEERRVVVDKELESMKQLSNKKDNNTIFVKLCSDKDKRKETSEKDERAKKSVSINEFLKPVEGERNYNTGGRGRGRGHGSRGGFSSSSSYSSSTFAAPAIEDHGQFPTLGGK
ncbi:RGG repeats nuclear RNA binding protein A-like protein [Drosera capensis]